MSRNAYTSSFKLVLLVGCVITFTLRAHTTLEHYTTITTYIKNMSEPQLHYRTNSHVVRATPINTSQVLLSIIIIRGATALMNLGRLSSRRWQSFPTAPDGTGFTCGQHIKSHSCIFSFPNRTVTSLFK
jgi:hypothetical protein